MIKPLHDIRLSVMFLSRIPVGQLSDVGPGSLAQASWAFPIAGLIVGAIAGGVLYLAASTHLHPLACAFIGVGVSILITGALHEDGLADVADGSGAYTRDRALEIMRDSHIGTFGALALIISLGLRVSALAGMAGPGMAAAALVGAAVFSRALLPLAMYLLPTARQDGRAHHAGRPTLGVVAVSVIIGIIALVLCLPGMLPLAAIGLTVFTVGLLLLWAHRKLGGQTGDVLGAVQQVAEIGVLLAAAAWSLDFI